MTLPLRRKRPTTARGPSAPTPTPVNRALALLVLGGCLLAGRAPAQDRPGGPRPEQRTGFRVPTDLPGPERLFRVDSEEILFKRMQQEARERRPPDRFVFPEEPVLSTTPYLGREWPQQTLYVEPHYLCHGRLYFEEPNSERFGWDLGPFSPVYSTLAFAKDFVLLPMHMFTDPCRHFDCSAGKCLPGDPVPFLCYPPEWSVTGTMAELTVIAALIAIFP
jgi:hypothetical protein